MKILINGKEFNVDIANTFKKKLKGLMGKRIINTGMLFTKTGSIHTFFMHANIDVIMLDKSKKIIYFKNNVRKNKIIIKRKAYYTIELPSNSIQNVIIGDKINFNITN